MSDEIRDADEGDLDAIAAIEAASFDRPWTREIFAQELARSIARLDVIGTPPVAFVCTWYVVDEAHLLRIAVASDQRRRGLARVLVQAVLARAAASGCTHVDLEVAADNAPALALYHALGFVEVGRRAGYYTSPPADALLLRAAL